MRAPLPLRDILLLTELKRVSAAVLGAVAAGDDLSLDLAPFPLAVLPEGTIACSEGPYIGTAY